MYLFQSEFIDVRILNVHYAQALMHQVSVESVQHAQPALKLFRKNVL